MLDHHKLVSLVSRASDLTETARELSERDRDYYDSHQWTVEEIAALEKRKQPVIIKNRIKRKIDAMVGIEQRSRVDPVAYPRTPEDEDAADVATKILRYVEEDQRLDQKASDVFYNVLIEGYGGCEVIVEQGPTGDFDVKINRLRWEEIFHDPHSREKDFSDAQFMGVQKWMSEDAALEYCAPMWQGDPDELAAMLDTQATEIGTSYEDRPDDVQMAWVDRRMRRVRIAQIYYKVQGQWHFAVFTGRGEIYNAVSPYVDEYGVPQNPMLLTCAYVDRENCRYGVVRDMISAQDEVNKRSSKMLHGINSRQTLAVKGALDSVDVFKREIASPDGHIELNIEAFEDAARVGMRPFEILPNNDQLSGQAALLAEAKQEIDLYGPNPALVGQGSTSASGRSIMAQQQAGLAELAPIYDNRRDWLERIYRAIMNRVRQFWTAPRYIRITDDERAPEFIGINQPVMTPQGPMVQNPVGQMEVDIIVTTSPEYATLRHEQFDKLAELARSGFAIPPQVIIEASDLKDKRKLLEAMQPPPEAQAMQAQMQQMQMEMQMRGAAAQIADKEASALKKQADAAKVQAEIQTTGVEAQKTMTEAAENVADAEYTRARTESERLAMAMKMREAMAPPVLIGIAG